MKTENIYASPQMEIVELLSEGVLCASGETQDYNYEDFAW